MAMTSLSRFPKEFSAFLLEDAAGNVYTVFHFYVSQSLLPYTLIYGYILPYTSQKFTYSLYGHECHGHIGLSEIFLTVFFSKNNCTYFNMEKKPNHLCNHNDNS